MSNIFLASKTCFLILVLVSTGRVRAGKRMSEEQRKEGMKILGSVFFTPNVRTDQWEQYQDPLANYYTNVAVNNIEKFLSAAGLASIGGGHADQLMKQGIKVTALPHEIGWKLDFPYLQETQQGIYIAIRKFLTEYRDKQIQSFLNTGLEAPSCVVGFGVDWIFHENTNFKENSTTDKKQNSNTGTKGDSAPGKGGYLVCVVVTTRRSKIFPIGSSNPNCVTESMVNFATIWANKSSLGQNFDPNFMADREKFVLKRRKISSNELERFLAHMKSATAKIVAKSQSKAANVIIAWANVFACNVEPTNDYVVVLGFEGLSDEKVIGQASQQDFMEHNFKSYQPVYSTGASCGVCQKSFLASCDQSNLPLKCNECGLVVDAMCSAKTPKVVGVALDVVGDVKVPIILKNCITLIEEKGVTTEGIYRISPPQNLDFDNLKSYFASGMDISEKDIWIYASKEVHVLCSLVKQFLRNLHPMLISSNIFAQLNEGWATAGPSMAESEAEENNVKLLNKWLNDLRPSYKVILKLILQHLHTLSTNAKQTKMEALNFGIIFGPNIIDLPPDADLDQVRANIALGNKIVEVMIKKFPSLVIANFARE